MLSISHSAKAGPSCYNVKISEPGTDWRGYTVIARDMTEVHEAVDHYYGSANRQQHVTDRRKCPLCRKRPIKSRRCRATTL